MFSHTFYCAGDVPILMIQTYPKDGNAESLCLERDLDYRSLRNLDWVVESLRKPCLEPSPLKLCSCDEGNWASPSQYNKIRRKNRSRMENFTTFNRIVFSIIDVVILHRRFFLTNFPNWKGLINFHGILIL